MADEPGATPDDTQPITEPQTDGGAVDGMTEDGEPQGFADFARADLTRQLNELEGGQPTESQDGTASQQSDDPTFQGIPLDYNKTTGGPPNNDPNAPQQTDGQPQPPDVFANLRATAEQFGDPQLAEAVNGHLAEFENYEREVSGYVQQVQQYASQIEQQEQQVNQRLQYLEQIAGDPRFRQALQAVTGQGGTAPAPTAGTQPGANPGNNPAPAPAGAPDFETDTERFLYQQLTEQQQKLHQIEQQQTARSQAEEQQRFAASRHRAHETLKKLATDLPQKFPGLQFGEDLHNKASLLIDGQAARGQTIDIDAAYEAAAKLLTYEDQQKQGAKRATETARAAARTSNHPGDARTSTTRQVNSMGDALELTKEQFRAQGKPIPAGV